MREQEKYHENMDMVKEHSFTKLGAKAKAEAATMAAKSNQFDNFEY